jgi:hypothetical protein
MSLGGPGVYFFVSALAAERPSRALLRALVTIFEQELS